MPWNPDQYNQFEKQRSEPFNDLLALVECRPHLRVIDLGCGTGTLTRQLADTLPDSDVLGLDSSPEMLERAAAQVRPGLRFEQGTIESLVSQPEQQGQWDLVFSNAAVQWVENHTALIPRLFALLRPGGQLAVQVPSNHEQFVHAALRETASETPFREAVDGWVREWSVLSIVQYADLLYANAGQKLTVFEKIYPHVLENADAVLAWSRGTAMVPFLERLPESLHEPFIARYRQRLHAHWPTEPVFFGFRRILFSATPAG